MTAPTGGATPESLSQQGHRRLIGVLGLLLPLLIYVMSGVLPATGLPRWKPVMETLRKLRRGP